MHPQTSASPLRARIRSAGSIFIVSLLLFACGARPGSPAPAPSRTQVRIAAPGDYPPFSHWPQNAARPEGFAPDLLHAWASATGRRIEWVRFDWPTLLDDARAGAFDLAAGGITIRPDRAVVGTFGIPLATSGAVALVARQGVTSLDRLDAPGMKLAVNRGGHLERVTRTRFSLAQIIPTTPNSAVPVRLAEGLADAAISDTREAPLWQQTHPDWVALGPFTRDRKAVFATLGNEALLDELDAWLLGPVGSATLDALRELHLGDDPRTAHVTRLGALLAAMDERLSLMPDIARYKQAHALAIDVPTREASVLEAAWTQVVEAAHEAGRTAPDKPRVIAFFTAQIDAAKEIQRRVVETPKLVAPGDAPDLDTQLRPALIRIGARISRLIPELSDDGSSDVRALTRQALADAQLSDASIAAIADALEELIQAPQPND